MSPDQLRAWLTLILTPGLGPARLQRLRNYFSYPTDALTASHAELKSAGLNDSLATALLDPVKEELLEQSLDWINASPDHHFVTIEDEHYPALLKQISDPPIALFIKGQVSLLSEWQLAMVGSRNPTPPGKDTAYAFSQYLAQAGLVITSGMALGIDAASHEGALDAGKATIAVTGNGLDRVYPAQHHELAHRIAEHGALVSEFPPGTKPLPQHFPQRNRIISGLSLGTLVVEAAQKSGSLITAYKALEQSREVFAIPGSIHNPLARGCHQLIREGAKLVETAADVFEELGHLAGTAQTIPAQTTENQSHIGLEPVHQQVLEAMAYDTVDIDTLAGRTGLSVNVLSSILLILELEGLVSKQSGGLYIQNS